MRNIVKDLIKSSLAGIAMAMVIFCIIGVVFDIGYQGNFSLGNYRFTQMVAGCAIIGLGFGLPTFVYNIDKLPMPVKVLIHMGIGCSIYTVVAYSVGWFGAATTIWQGLAIAGIQIAVAFIIWFCFMRYYRHEAKVMNDKIQEMKK